MKKQAKKYLKMKFMLPIGFLIIFFLLILGIIFSLMFILSSDDGSNEGDNIEYIHDGEAIVNEAIERLRPLFEKYARIHGIPDQVELLMAIAMQESGGRHLDVMQSSESIGLPPNSIIRPEVSIDVGTRYYSQMFTNADGERNLALQSYNFGGGFIDYAMNNGGEYSKELAVEFSNMQAEKLGWERYGDVNYVPNVMRYMTGIDTNPQFGGEWSYPLKRPQVTSEFGTRSDPFTGEEKFHGGTDFGCDVTDSIYAVEDGTVTQAINFHVSFGNYVMVKHNNNEYSLYAHLTRFNVSEGDSVDKGQQVGVCGSTGRSTGPHLHLEYHVGGERKDPAPKFNNDGE